VDHGIEKDGDQEDPGEAEEIGDAEDSIGLVRFHII
jgi:hypothetical protein